MVRWTEEEARDYGFFKDRKGNWHSPAMDPVLPAGRSRNLSESKQVVQWEITEPLKGKKRVKRESEQSIGHAGSGRATDSSGPASRGGIEPEYRIVITTFSRRHRDLDNIVPKVIIDEIVKRGVLPDDSSKYIESITHRFVKIGKKEEENTVIEIYKYQTR